MGSVSNNPQKLIFGAVWFCLALILFLTTRPYQAGAAGSEEGALSASSIVLIPVGASKQESVRIAEVLKGQIEDRSDVTVRIGGDEPLEGDLHIYIGYGEEDGKLKQLSLKHQIELPGKPDPAPEGYAVKMLADQEPPTLVALGADQRGAFYAAGEVLRQMRFEPDRARIGDVDVRSAPAYRFRGFSPNQGGTMRKMTGARPWTEEEVFQTIHEYALAGANCFYAGHRGGAVYDHVKSFDLMSVTGVRPNEHRGEFPEEWRAGGLEDWEGDHWVCPCIPEARRLLLSAWKDEFELRPHHEILRMYAGDPGGCRDDRCMPWGKTFVHLCEEVADLWLEEHPDSIVLIANQDLTNEGDRAIFDYLNEKPRDWLYGICYGPGSNALSWYFRDELREDLLIYPRSGPWNRYLAEIIHHIPSRQQIVHFSDITHYISAQYAAENPEPNLVRSYGRRTFHARPRAFYKIFQAIMPFSEGDIIYSEGYHDEFHQYLWSRLLWNPNRELEDIMREYCLLYFGKAASPKMMEALLQLEKNIESPLATNEGIDSYYLLVKEAGRLIPDRLMKNNHRWRLHMQKAALDKYSQLKLRIEQDKEGRIAKVLQMGLDSGELDGAVVQALAILEEPAETPEMSHLREEAGVNGEESEEIHGVRNVGYFKLDQPLRHLAGIQAELEKAQNSDAAQAKEDRMAAAVELTRAPTDVGNIFW